MPRLFSALPIFGLALVLIHPIGPADTADARTLEPQTMRDWTVRCTDSRYCIAQTKGESRQGEKILFKLERSNNVDSGIYLTTAPDDRKLSQDSHITISIVGDNYKLSGPVTKVYDGNEAAFKRPSADEAIQKLRFARFGQITVRYAANSKPITYDISLQGVSSVLAMMDVMQGRLDREDAAVVVGGEAKTVPSFYDLQAGKAPQKPSSEEKSEAARDPEENIVYPEDDADTAEAIEDGGLGVANVVYSEDNLPSAVLMPGYRMLNCDLPATVEAWGAKIINVEPGVFLYLVPCHNADVNVPYYAALEVAGQIDTTEFQVPASAAGQRESLITNADWDKANQSLISTKYFSAARDCGQFERHGLNPSDDQFYLSEYRLKQNCDGQASPPENYPVEWNGEGD